MSLMIATHSLCVCVFLLGAYFDPFSVLVSVLMLYFSLRLSDLVVLTRVCVCVSLQAPSGQVCLTS